MPSQLVMIHGNAEAMTAHCAGDVTRRRLRHHGDSFRGAHVDTSRAEFGAPSSLLMHEKGVANHLDPISLGPFLDGKLDLTGGPGGNYEIAATARHIEPRLGPDRISLA